MKNFMAYFKYDLTQLFSRNTTRYLYVFLFSLIILDTIFTYFSQVKLFQNTAEMSADWYVFLENGASIFRTFYFLTLPILAILPFGSQHYYEKNSKYRELLIIRGSRSTYYLSKCITNFIIGFLTIFITLILNYIIVYIIYPNNFIIGGLFLEPDKGAFLEKIFFENTMLYHFIYIVINALVGGIFSLLAFSLSMVFSYKNKFLVIAVPFILFTIQSVILFFFNVHYDIMHIIQPLTRYGLIEPITNTNVITTFSLWFIFIIIILIFGYKKEGDLL